MGLGELGAFGAVLAGVLVVLGKRRLVVLAGLLVHYASVGVMLIPVLGQEIALAKIIAGSVATSILWFSTRSEKDQFEVQSSDLIDRLIFRGALLGLVLTAGWGIGRAEWLNIPTLSAAAENGATMLLALGLMVAAFFEDPFRMGIGIIIGVSGFEIVYGAVEPSLAVLALLAGVQLSLALVVGYLSQLRDPMEQQKT